MVQLASRLYATPDEFVARFLETLTPGVIPRAEFVGWDEVERKSRRLHPYLAFYNELAQRIRVGRNLVQELADCLTACDDPFPFVQCAFELLGHTSPELVTREDDVDIREAARAIASGDEATAMQLAQILEEMGLRRVLLGHELADLLLGIQIGLETHRRKNIGGQCFATLVRETLEFVVAKLSAQLGSQVRSDQEVTIPYGDGLTKVVDFAITVDRTVRYGIEVNFYTVPGSKPSEIKRSYADVRQGLLSAGVDLIWITDGKGYRSMQRSLRDAYVVLPNIYNLRQAQKYLAQDLASALSSSGPDLISKASKA